MMQICCLRRKNVLHSSNGRIMSSAPCVARKVFSKKQDAKGWYPFQQLIDSYR